MDATVITMSRYQILSEDFIREHVDQVDWIYVSQFQRLSGEFIFEFIKKIHPCDRTKWYLQMHGYYLALEPKLPFDICGHIAAFISPP